ncbi:glycosyl transferase [Terrabacter sp. Soil811]|nr:glycosyl transferase [Terrabacter sp. Soil811]
MPWPLVSVVVPTYNNAAFVRETMRSILSQTFEDFELIVSDHSSTDGTWEALQPFAVDPRVRLMRIKASGRAEDNWRNATSAATGEFLKLVCGDDLLAPDSIERQVAALRDNPAAVMVASRRDVVTACGDVVLRSWGLSGLVGTVSGSEAARRGVLAGTNPFGEPACVMLRRRVLMEVGSWDASFPYVIDQYTYSKVLMHGDFVGLADSLASFRLSDSQWSVALADQQYRQIVSFHQVLAETYPGLLSRSHRIRAGARARALTYARRVAYLSLQRRLRSSSVGLELATSVSSKPVVPGMPVVALTD